MCCLILKSLTEQGRGRNYTIALIKGELWGYASAMSNFIELIRPLETTVLKLKSAHDPNLRRELMAEMRRLLQEVDRLDVQTL